MRTKHAIFRITTYLVLLFIIDSILGIILSHLYYTQKETVNSRFTYSMFDAKEDVIIYGNSRALCHYNPRILKDSLHKSCYNAGRDGGYCILVQAAQILSLLKYHVPKVIICEYDFNYMDYRAIDYQRLNILLPYADRDQYVHEIIELRSPYEKYKLISKIYPFNSTIINIIRYNINPKKSRLSIYGYDPVINHNNRLDLSKKYPEIVNTYPDVNKFKALERIINVCKINNIKLLFVNSPIYKYKKEVECVIHKQPSVADSAIQILIKSNIPYIDMSNDTMISNHEEYFFDMGHLNAEGSKLFSKRIASRIKQIIILSENN